MIGFWHLQLPGILHLLIQSLWMVFHRYDEMASKSNVEYIAGGKLISCSLWFLVMPFLWSCLQTCLIIMPIFLSFAICWLMYYMFIVLSLGATQNSIRVAQVCLCILREFCILFKIWFNHIVQITNLNFCVILLQWMLQVPDATSYIGSIGKDKFGEEMKKNSKLAGVNVSFSTSSPTLLIPQLSNYFESQNSYLHL